MKKVLIIFDGNNFSKGAFEFARRLNIQERILLTGVFLPQVQFSNLWSYASAMEAPLFVPLLEGEEVEEIRQNIAQFEYVCNSNDIDYRVHRDFFDFALNEVKRESRFADLMIIGNEKFYDSLGAHDANENLRDLLHESECPVILVPEKFEFPESIVLAYDGTDSSVFAIKQFAYLLPGLARKSTILAYAGTNGDEHMPEEDYIRELAARHYPDLTITMVAADVKKNFNAWMEDRRAPILVSGAFGRSGFSRLFRKSFAAETIRQHRMPVFIAHR